MREISQDYTKVVPACILPRYDGCFLWAVTTLGRPIAPAQEGGSKIPRRLRPYAAGKRMGKVRSRRCTGEKLIERLPRFKGTYWMRTRLWLEFQLPVHRHGQPDVTCEFTLTSPKS
jgi:hypothetical protein